MALESVWRGGTGLRRRKDACTPPFCGGQGGAQMVTAMVGHSGGSDLLERMGGRCLRGCRTDLRMLSSRYLKCTWYRQIKAEDEEEDGLQGGRNKPRDEAEGIGGGARGSCWVYRPTLALDSARRANPTRG
jgi:hypothetical protein